MYQIKRYISLFNQIIVMKYTYVNGLFTKKINVKEGERSGFKKKLHNYPVLHHVKIGTIA
jgi:hypothetical protein